MSRRDGGARTGRCIAGGGARRRGARRAGASARRSVAGRRLAATGDNVRAWWCGPTQPRRGELRRARGGGRVVDRDRYASGPRAAAERWRRDSRATGSTRGRVDVREAGRAGDRDDTGRDRRDPRARCGVACSGSVAAAVAAVAAGRARGGRARGGAGGRRAVAAVDRGPWAALGRPADPELLVAARLPCCW